MPLEPHVADDFGLEQAHRVARGRIAKAGKEFVGDRGAADDVGGLEDRDLQALPRQIISAGEPVMAGADDDRVVHQRISTSSSAMVG